MTNHVILAFAAGIALYAGANSAGAATLNGVSMSATYLFPDQSTVYPQSTGTGTFVVGAGLDGTVNVEGVTDIFLDFADNTLDVSFSTSLSNPTWTNTAFSGLKISLESLGEFSSFALVSSTFSSVSTSFDADNLFINWAGASYTTGSSAVFTVGYDTPAPVPLPAGLPLLGLGLAMVTALRRKRRG